uniref:sn-1-specific diacylglycerol lipase ABHD11 n=1 Tax=Dermatophagoides pteronyssinus TaxID=6956 RepID=A0A6P6XTN4_DERPT|nr:protein ABHD11-like [Dermatophagoides pteronyssinus]
MMIQINFRSRLIVGNYFRQSIRYRSDKLPVPLSFVKAQPKSISIDINKKPLLSFHGLFGSKINLRSLMNQICTRTKQPCYSFDLRNHGESPHVDGDKSDMNAMASDILLWMDTNQIDRADLLGHSLGGRVISQFAFDWPDRVDRLILVDISPLPTLPKIDFLTENFFDLLEDCIKQLPAQMNLSQARQHVRTRLIEVISNTFIVDFFLLNLYQDKDGKIKWHFNTRALEMLVRNRMAHQLDTNKPFNGKSLIIYGEQSDYVRPDQFDQIRMIMPNVQFVNIANTGHYLHVEKAQQFIDIVVDFLKKSNS